MGHFPIAKTEFQFTKNEDGGTSRPKGLRKDHAKLRDMFANNGRRKNIKILNAIVRVHSFLGIPRFSNQFVKQMHLKYRVGPSS